MLANYLPIFVFLVIALLLGVALVIAGHTFSVHRPNKIKNAPYECGFSPKKSARIPVDVRFYLVAILFILFDLEATFLIPWAVNIRALGWSGVAAVGVFFLLLLVGFCYEWRKGGLDWE